MELACRALTECNNIGCIIGGLWVLYTPNCPLYSVLGWTVLTLLFLFFRKSTYEPFKIIYWLIFIPMYLFTFLLVALHLIGYLIPYFQQFLTDSAHSSAWLILFGWLIALSIHHLYQRQQ